MGTLHWNSTYFHVDWKWCRWFSSQCLLSLCRRFCLYTFHIPFVWCSLYLSLCVLLNLCMRFFLWFSCFFSLSLRLFVCVCVYFRPAQQINRFNFELCVSFVNSTNWTILMLCVFFFVHLFCFKYFCNFGWIFIKCASVTYAPVIILNLSLHVLNKIAGFFFLSAVPNALENERENMRRIKCSNDHNSSGHIFEQHFAKKKNIEYLFILRHILKRWEAMWTISKIPNIIKVCVLDWMLLFSNRTKSARSHTHTHTHKTVFKSWHSDFFFYPISLFVWTFQLCFFALSHFRSTFNMNICCTFSI